MSRAVLSNSILCAALLVLGSAAPLVGSAHSEGVEAADPATPPAVLRFESAVGRYAGLAVRRSGWRTLFEPASGVGAQQQTTTDMHSGHAGHGQQPPATPGR